jgi:hypothetical protein
MSFVKTVIHLTFFAFFCTVLSPAFGQGNWNPTGADLSYPRTLLKASALTAVQQSLQDPERKALYASVYDWTMATPPSAASTTTEDRRLRARAAKNTAFVRLINLHPYNNLQPFTASETAQLEANAISLLENLNTSVAGNALSYTDWQWRSKELIDYLIAYDLLRGAGVPEASLQTSKTKLQEFSTNLYTKASASLFGYVFLNTIKNNHLLMTASALGMAGVVLNDATSATTASQPQTWINAGMYAVDNVLWRDAQRQSEPGVLAGYAEGPYYFKYAMLNCLPFFRAFGNFLPDGTYSFTWNNTTRQIRNPYYDPNYDLLYQWATDITMPDGRLPALEDSYIDMAMPELAITGKPQFVKNFYPQNLESPQLITLNAQLDGTVDLRANYLAANVNPLNQDENPLTALPYSGNLIYRSGSGFTGKYLHVYGKNGKPLTNSGGHNHGDASSFSLYAYGQLLALDAGYLSSTRRAEVGNATNHNLILVNGAGPQIGTAGAANDAEAFIQNTFETKTLTYGEVKTAYSGATITRKTLNIRGDYYLMADFVSAASPQNFTWQLHGYGLGNGTASQGDFTGALAAGEGTWKKNGVSLQARVTATNGASNYDTTASIHEITYNTTSKHTTFLAKKNTVSETQFLAALMPFTTDVPVSEILNLTDMAGLVKTTTGYTDLAFTKSDTLLKTVTATALSVPVQSDANFTFYSLNGNGDFAQLFLQNGSTFFTGADQFIKCNKRADLAWEQIAPGEYNGYISKAATVQVKITHRPNQVTGDNLSGWTYDANTQILEATFSQASDYQFKVSQDPLPVELVYFKAEKVNAHVKLTWQTATEKNNRRFVVQRSADARTWETLAAIAGQGTTSKLSQYEFLDTPALSGKIYYRLQQEDLDGSIQYSPVQVVTFEKQFSPELLLYPNPASENLTIKMATSFGGNAEIRVLSPAGAEIYKQENVASKDGNSFEVNVAGLPAGFYILSLRTANQTWQAKFIKR